MEPLEEDQRSLEAERVVESVERVEQNYYQQLYILPVAYSTWYNQQQLIPFGLNSYV